MDYKREKLIQVQQYINTQSNEGILLMLNEYYDGEHVIDPQPVESMKNLTEKKTSIGLVNKFFLHTCVYKC